MKSGLVVLVTCLWVAACAALSNADQKEITEYGRTLAGCQVAAAAAHEQCMADGGTHCDPVARAAYAACMDGGAE